MNMAPKKTTKCSMDMALVTTTMTSNQYPTTSLHLGRWYFTCTQAPGGDNHIANGDHSKNETVATTKACPKRNVGTYKDSPTKIRCLPIEGEEYEFAFNVNIISDWEQSVPAVLN